MFDGKCNRAFASILEDLESFVGSLEPETYSPRDVPVLLGRVARAEKLCAAARLLLARRAATLHSDERHGAVSSARWLAGQSGDGIGVARRDLEIAAKLSSQPELEQALRSGDISPSQASVLLPALEADPAAASELLEAAAREQLKVLRERCQSVVASRRTEEEASAREARLREQRHLRFGTTFEGAITIRGELAPLEGAVVRNALEAMSREIFVEARRAGRRESHEAYLADGLVSLCGSRSGPASSTHQGSPRAEIVLHVSAEALRRGELEPGEFCEIAGVGPVSLSTVEYLFGSSLAKVIVERGVDVASVTHAGRWIPAHIDSALSSRDRVCAVPGCGIAYGLERDHIVPVEDGGQTELSNLVRLCHRHHFLKTHRYWRLLGEPGRWRWVRIRSQDMVPEGVTDDVARAGEPTVGLARPLLGPVRLPPDSVSGSTAAEHRTGARVPCAQQAFTCAWRRRQVVVRLELDDGAPSYRPPGRRALGPAWFRSSGGRALGPAWFRSSGRRAPAATERPELPSPGGAQTREAVPIGDVVSDPLQSTPRDAEPRRRCESTRRDRAGPLSRPVGPAGARGST